ncbi:hypothetical protein [Sphingomonas sp. LHG3443-2]|uniref:hypothetical protein n=1 Tax=Sphingomonas sp. LHG3443-2 TaxID=2804639 RepID=UPI003CE985B7
MSFATAINLLTILLCSAVLVQCWRMTRALDRFRRADFPGTVTALQAATVEAEGVLRRIRHVLATEAEPKLHAIADASQAADELGVMIGIANASADRLLDVARQTRVQPGDLAA